MKRTLTRKARAPGARLRHDPRVPDDFTLLRLLDEGKRQVDLARALDVTEAAMSTRVRRARGLARLSLLGSDRAIAQVSEKLGVPRSALNALIGAALRWQGNPAGFAARSAFVASLRGSFDWASAGVSPADAIAALQRACASAPAAGERTAAGPRVADVSIPASDAEIRAAVASRAAGQLDARGLARRLRLPGSGSADSLRYPAIAGVIAACDLAIAGRTGHHPVAALRGAVQCYRSIIARLARAPSDVSLGELARRWRVSRWRVSVALHALGAAARLAAACGTAAGKPVAK